MLDNIKDSIKAKLYDFAYTPFMSSFIITWIIINHKYLLIYFGDEKVADKIKLLNDHVFEKIPYQGYDWWADQFWYPLEIALGYVFVYPFFALGFYAITLWYKKWSKDVRTKIEKLTPIHPDEAAKINIDISRLEDEKDAAVKKLREKEDEYNKKVGNLESEIVRIQIEKNNAEKQTEQRIAEKKQIENQLSQANEFLASKNDEYAELEKKVVELEKQLASVGVVNATAVLSGGLIASSSEEEDARIKVLKYLHDSYETTYETNLLDKIMVDMGIARAVARKIINDLIQENILSIDSIKQISITPENNLKLIEMMKDRHA